MCWLKSPLKQPANRYPQSLPLHNPIVQVRSEKSPNDIIEYTCRNRGVASIKRVWSVTDNQQYNQHKDCEAEMFDKFFHVI